MIQVVGGEKEGLFLMALTPGLQGFLSPTPLMLCLQNGRQPGHQQDAQPLEASVVRDARCELALPIASGDLILGNLPSYPLLYSIRLLSAPHHQSRPLQGLCANHTYCLALHCHSGLAWLAF